MTTQQICIDPFLWTDTSPDPLGEKRQKVSPFWGKALWDECNKKMTKNMALQKREPRHLKKQ